MVPTSSSIAAAGSLASSLSATNFNVVDGSGTGTYPLANFSWTLLYQKQSSTSVATALGRLFDWVITTGQAHAVSLGYSPLPANVVALSHRTLLQLQTSSGTPLFTG